MGLRTPLGIKTLLGLGPLTKILDPPLAIVADVERTCGCVWYSSRLAVARSFIRQWQ